MTIIDADNLNDIKFENNALYNLDTTLAKIIAAGLIQYRKNSVGYPGCFDNLSSSKGAEVWQKKLNRMAFAFTELGSAEAAKSPDFYESKEYKKRISRMKKGMKDFIKYFSDLWI